MIVDNVVYSGPALKIPAHLSFGQFVIDRLREDSEKENTVVLVRIILSVL